MKKKVIRLLAVIFSIMMVLAGCGAGTEKSDAKMESSAAYDSEWVEAPMEVPEAEEAIDAAATGMTADEVGDPNRKLIKRYNLNMETEEFDDLMTYIKDSVAVTGGYIESSNISGSSIGSSGTRSAYYVLRIPVSDAESFVAALEDKGHVTHKSEEVEDVTLDYVDTQSRIESLRIEQEALMDMLEKADTLESILTLQNRLTEVRYQLESYESQLRSYDNLIEYTTITIDLYEVKREIIENDGSFGARLKERLADNFYNFGQDIQNVVIAVVGALPYWILLAVIALITWLIIKLILKRIGKKEEERERACRMPEPVAAETNKENQKDVLTEKVKDKKED